MTRLPVLILIACSLLLSAGCSHMQAQDYQGQQPPLVLEEYFRGELQAWGMFQNRRGEVKRRFRVDIDGRMEGDELVLQEDFVYADGERQQRIWRIHRLDEHHYEGRADDVVGVARGAQYGNALNWEYKLRLEVGGKHYVVHFDDWMFLQDERVMINRATMRKWGIRLGEVTLVFVKTDPGTTAP
ncbi:DUF3833 domain-containing protein [Thiohalobacter sp. COW1]|uniref:DUF3833 domain-containing protein n=1 Tax=Thiohalobacter sp. COW1 TaxID=2795687 RepID=UPI001915EAF5|nr:DUF3833 domain-containing protein [Thiohalobacter sp. COW1]